MTTADPAGRRVVAEGDPWWRSATPEELARTAGLVAGMLEPNPATPIDPALSARALAIRQLCVNDSLLADVLQTATTRTRSHNRSVGDGAEITAAKAWLAHGVQLGDVFGRAVDLLQMRDMADAQKLLREFDEAVRRLRGDLIEIEVARGTSRRAPIFRRPLGKLQRPSGGS